MNNPLVRWFSVFLSTGFYLSYLPTSLINRLSSQSSSAKSLQGKKWTGAGFIGSLIGAIFYLLLPYEWVNNVWGIVIFGVIAIGASHVAEAHFKVKDDSRIIIDEWLGVWITFLGMSQIINWHFIAGFILFRVFDFWKGPWMTPLQKLPGGLGIVMDDILAGMLARFFIYFLR